MLDWDKLSSNDYIGATAFHVSDLIADAPQPLPAPGPSDSTSSSAAPTMASASMPILTDDGNADEDEDDTAARERGTRIPLYAEEESGDHPMKEFKLKLETGGAGREPVLWESKHNPVISFRCVDMMHS